MFLSIVFGILFIALVIYLVFRKQKKKEVHPRKDA